MSIEDEIAQAQAIADQIRPVAPEQADRIEAEIKRFRESDDKSDGLNIKTEITYRLEKFDGDYRAGKQPVEVIDGVG